MSNQKVKNRFKNKCSSLINYTCIVILIECLILVLPFFQKNQNRETVLKLNENVILDQESRSQKSDIYEMLTRNVKAGYFKMDVRLYNMRNVF